MNKNTYIVIFFILSLISLYIFKDLPTPAPGTAANANANANENPGAGGGTTEATGGEQVTGTGTGAGTGAGTSSGSSTATKTTEQIVNEFYNAFEVSEKEEDANRAIKEVDALNDETLAKVAIAFYDKYRKNMLSITGISSYFGCGYSSETCNLLRKTRNRLEVLQSNSNYNPKSYVDAFIL